MPYQIKNGIIYSGNAVTLTQAQYDALTTAEKNNGTVYYIYDSDAMIEAQEVGLDGGNVETLAGSVATFESSPSTAVHDEGEYILYQAQLYKVTSAIAVGEDLTVGSNIEATSVGEELTTLNNGLSETNSTVSRLSIFQSGWIAASGVSNLDLLPVNNVFGVFWLNNTDSGIVGTKPSSEGMGLLFNLRQSSTICRQVYIGITNSSNCVRYYAYSTGTWSAWSAVTI